MLAVRIRDHQGELHQGHAQGAKPFACTILPAWPLQLRFLSTSGFGAWLGALLGIPCIRGCCCFLLLLRRCFYRVYLSSFLVGLGFRLGLLALALRVWVCFAFTPVEGFRTDMSKHLNRF